MYLKQQKIHPRTVNLPSEPYSPRCKTEDPDYLPDLVDSKACTVCSEKINKAMNKFLKLLKRPDGGTNLFPQQHKW